jgi:hypothetical protein
VTDSGASEGRGHVIRPLRWEDEPAYRAFCQREFGPTHQGREGYLRWLYEDNPAGRGIGDALVAMGPSGDVIGCIHRLRLPWRVDDQAEVIPSLHNLMVAEAHRGGLGFFLLMAAVKGETHAIVPGVEGRLQEAYVRMRYQRLPSRWYRRVVDPARFGMQAVLHRVGRPEPAPRVPPNLSSAMDGFELTTSPDDRAVADVATALVANARASGADAAAHVDWTPELVAWRFFSARGPRHVLARDVAAGTLAILSIGPRHGITVARLMAWSPTALSADVLSRLAAIAKRLGAAALLAFEVRPGGASGMAAAGWQPRTAAPGSFLYSRGRAILEVDLDGGGTDQGFEAIADA